MRILGFDISRRGLKIPFTQIRIPFHFLVGFLSLSHACSANTKAVNLISQNVHSTVENNNEVSTFILHNGIPPNGTDLCYSMQPIICEQFYVTQNKSLVIRGMVKFQVEDYPPTGRSLPEYFPLVKNAWENCGGNKTESELKPILDDPSIQTKTNSDLTNYWTSFTGTTLEETTLSPPYATLMLTNTIAGLSNQSLLIFSNRLDSVKLRDCIENNLPKPKLDILDKVVNGLTIGVTFLGVGSYLSYLNRHAIKRFFCPNSRYCCPNSNSSNNNGNFL